MKSIVTDLSTITNISERTIRRLLKDAFALLYHYVAESSVEQTLETKVDFEVGTFVIQIKGDEILTSFKFDKKSSESLIEASTKNKSLLEDMVDEEIATKLNEKFKELL